MPVGVGAQQLICEPQQAADSSRNIARARTIALRDYCFYVDAHRL
jgi:hypothetical protein